MLNEVVAAPTIPVVPRDLDGVPRPQRNVVVDRPTLSQLCQHITGVLRLVRRGEVRDEDLKELLQSEPRHAG
jgi:hypothetical protein